ncbi:unnamed protein product, partial [Prorocentrum cordatum]
VAALFVMGPPTAPPSEGAQQAPVAPGRDLMEEAQRIREHELQQTRDFEGQVGEWSRGHSAMLEGRAWTLAAKNCEELPP